jgi:hypothetical protein
MQDNPIDPKWEDQGWNMMKDLLDQEMPTATVPRKRPFAALIPVAALLALTGLSLFAFWLANERFAQTETPPIAAFAIPMLPNETETQATQQAKATTPSYTAVASRPQASSLALPAASKSPAPVESTASINPTSGSNTSIPSATTTTPATPALEQHTAAPSPLPESTIPTDPSLPVLPALPKPQIEVLPSTDPDLPGQPTQAKTASHIRYGIEASIGSADFSAAQAWSAGVFAQLPLGKQSKWHASLSTGYQQILQTRTVNEQSFLFGNSRFPNTTGAIVLQSRTQLTQLNYLYFLPQIGYNFHPRWSVEAGLQYAYLLSQRNNTRWSVLSNTQETTPADDEQEALLGDLPERTNNSKLPLHQHQFSLQLGLSYRINNKLSVAAQWQQGLTSIYPQGGQDAYNRFLSVGLGYGVR